MDATTKQTETMRRRNEAMYTCDYCGSVFTLAIYRRPDSMPGLHTPMHCPFCMTTGIPRKLHRANPDTK